MAKPKLTPEQHRERVDHLGVLADRVADVLDVDPERIFYDADANHLSIPASLVEALLAKIEES